MSFRRIYERLIALPPEERLFGTWYYYEPGTGCRCAVGALLGLGPQPPLLNETTVVTRTSNNVLFEERAEFRALLDAAGASVEEAQALQTFNDCTETFGYLYDQKARYGWVMAYVRGCVLIEEKAQPERARDEALLELMGRLIEDIKAKRPAPTAEEVTL